MRKALAGAQSLADLLAVHGNLLLDIGAGFASARDLEVRRAVFDRGGDLARPPARRRWFADAGFVL